ncbi:MAG: hypothetical protein ACT6RE_16630 [Flavobacteriales bacterium]
MKQQLSVFLFILVLLSAGCVDDRKYKTFTGNEIFILEVPEELNPVENQKKNAAVSLAGNERTPVEVIVSYEPKEGLKTYGVAFSLDEMYQLEVDQFGEYLQELKTETPAECRVEYMQGLRGLISGKRNGREMIYDLTVCDAPRYYFRYAVGAPAEYYKKHKVLIEDIRDSFEEYKDFKAKDGSEGAN